MDNKTDTKPDDQTSKAKPNNSRGIWSTIGMLVIATLIAFILTTYVFQQYQVDGPSMQTTLFNDDRLIVVKYQRTWARITGHPYIPNRGDIIIFNESGLYNVDGVAEKQLVKRVIGLPGDRVVVSNGILKIYNSDHPNGFSPDETMPYGKVIGYTGDGSNGKDINIVLPKNYIFVCGDNRPDSLDSRYFGPINVNQVIGKLAFRIYPFNDAKVF